MKQRTEDNIMAFVAGLLLFCCLFVGFEAIAGEVYKHKPPPKQVTNNVDRNNEAKSFSDSESVANSISTSEAAASATNEGNALSVNSSYESGPADLVLVPNNNTENCLRVFGFSFGNREGSGMLGVPFRSKSCDYEQAADDAFAAGERELGWFWKCQNKSLYKTFQLDGMSKDEAKDLCHRKAVGEIGKIQTIEALKDDLAFLQREREIEREKCEASKDRIVGACFNK